MFKHRQNIIEKCVGLTFEKDFGYYDKVSEKIYARTYTVKKIKKSIQDAISLTKIRKFDDSNEILNLIQTSESYYLNIIHTYQFYNSVYLKKYEDVLEYLFKLNKSRELSMEEIEILTQVGFLLNKKDLIEQVMNKSKNNYKLLMQIRKSYSNRDFEIFQTLFRRYLENDFFVLELNFLKEDHLSEILYYYMVLSSLPDQHLVDALYLYNEDLFDEIKKQYPEKVLISNKIYLSKFDALDSFLIQNGIVTNNEVELIKKGYQKASRNRSIIARMNSK